MTAFLRGNTTYAAAPKIRAYQAGRLLPVLTVSELFGSKAHQQWLKEVRAMAECDDALFQHFYMKSISTFTEFVQVLPYASHEPLSSLLNYSLARARLGLQQLVTTHPDDNTALERFAVFTAGLLTDVNKAVINQKVIFSNAQGEHLNEWRPFEGAMMGKTKYYKMYPLGTGFQRLDHSLSIMLARQLLSEDAFQWLSSDFYLFADWLDALINEGRGGSGRLQQALQYIKHQDLLMSLDNLMVLSFDMLDSPATEHGGQFLEWLKNKLANNDINMNSADASVHVTKRGLLIERTLFTEYVDMVRSPVKSNVVFTQFGNMMGIVKRSPLEGNQFFSDYPDVSTKRMSLPLSGKQGSIRSGLLVNPEMVFMKGSPAATKMLRSTRQQAQSRHSLPADQDASNTNEKVLA